MDMVVPGQADHDQEFPTSFEKCEAQNVTRNSFRTKFLVSIGAHEYFSSQMWRAALTELVATAFLMFTLTSSIISCLDSQEVDPKLLVALAVFIIAFLFLMATVPLSGGHMSPVFTFIACLKGVITLARASIYVLAQCVGSIMGFLLIRIVMNHQTAHKYYLGGCTIDANGATSAVSRETALILEFSCTFVVLFVGVTVGFDKKRCKELGLAVVCGVVAGAMALAVFVSVTVTGQAGYAGVGLNPARCYGPALLEGGVLWDGHWVFWLGPFLACIVYYAYSISMPN